MSSNTKQSEDTYIRWSANMENKIQVGQFATEPVLTIHPDGRVTSSPRLKPDKISALVLDQIKTQWMDDIQCTKIRGLEDRIKRLEEKLRSVKRKQAVLVSDVVLYEDRGERIKQLEEALSCVVVSCAYLHHPKKYRHKLYEACPVENLIKKARKAKP